MLVAALCCAVIGFICLVLAVQTTGNLFSILLVISTVLGLGFWFVDHMHKLRRNNDRKDQEH